MILVAQRVAFLVTDNYEPSELTEPWKAVAEAGAEPVLVSPKQQEVSGKEGAHAQPVDLEVAQAKAEDFDALVLPGGTGNADAIRLDENAVAFTRGFFDQNKLVAAICHGAWILTDAEVLQGRKLTSFPSLKTDLRNAGATWVDEEVVVDGKLISSRTPADLDAFNREIVNKLG
ncbi:MULTISPECIES: type 1 glutamine amidotransferase domain-containing protein [unclassified Auritidibacter]|uniref:type 1 glutamine amidotransferase domain-containing protein n=1 Tax=Auritidibacter TaxID=1160973 RepID=UPI000D73C4C7|nr:type 1 glutamine amidotransferase [Auritidibacter sp. NML130574]PXA75508.1 peptidase C56 [Auritidibacter sp. NML100628]PXA79963.1 peptidase C56 [Auritidibacter sp. NML120636]